ncbi:hypothetical protein GQ607_005644 [Colletotrichum asianum]|uniref:PIN domain-containing protein n=1 Tax=Colletotrichum asianum TaxID=702518 RepID=A0A8H3ZUN6_9PEZI|nr:hypothetical protein GQ607_005644 [Colletotrichum asianum]
MGVAKKTRKFGQAPSGLYFQSNQDLGPPYHIILDTNFFAHTVRHKIDVVMGLMDLLLAKCTPVVTECTIAELEKLGPKFRLALRLAKDERFRATEVLALWHLRKVPGVPLIAVGKGKYSVERLPEIAI